MIKLVIKLLIRISLLLALAVIAFLAVSVYSGGGPIRKVGKLAKQAAYQVAKAADAIKGFTDDIVGGSEDKAEGAKEDIEEKAEEAKDSAKSTFGKIKKGVRETFVWENGDGK